MLWCYEVRCQWDANWLHNGNANTLAQMNKLWVLIMPKGKLFFKTGEQSDCEAHAQLNMNLWRVAWFTSSLSSWIDINWLISGMSSTHFRTFPCCPWCLAHSKIQSPQHYLSTWLSKNYLHFPVVWYLGQFHIKHSVLIFQYEMKTFT